MRRLNLKDYTVRMKIPDKGNPGQEIMAEFPYRVKDSILNLMFIPELKLSSAELVRQNILAMKLENCKEDDIMLEESEWQRIKGAVDIYKGFNRNDVGLVERINEAEVVEVEKKPESKS